MAIETLVQCQDPAHENRLTLEATIDIAALVTLVTLVALCRLSGTRTTPVLISRIATYQPQHVRVSSPINEFSGKNRSTIRRDYLMFACMV